MNEVLENIYTRRSVRKYQDRMVPKDVLSEIANAGIQAPSAMGRDHVVVLMVTDKSLRDRLSLLNARVMGTDSDPFYGAPVVAVVLADKTMRNGIYDGSVVMENMMLAAHSLGVSSCWIHRAKQVFDTEEGRAILKEIGLEGEYEGVGNCILGYADGQYPEKKEKTNKIIWA